MRLNVNPNLKPSPTAPTPEGPLRYIDTRERCLLNKIIESPGGKFWKAERWEFDHWRALHGMLIAFGFFGEGKHDKLAFMYNAGLRLPVETEKDWALMEQAVQGGKRTTLDAAHTFIEELKKIAPQKAKVYE